MAKASGGKGIRAFEIKPWMLTPAGPQTEAGISGGETWEGWMKESLRHCAASVLKDFADTIVAKSGIDALLNRDIRLWPRAAQVSLALHLGLA